LVYIPDYQQQINSNAAGLTALTTQVGALNTLAQHIQAAAAQQKYSDFGSIITASRVLTKPAQNTSYRIDTTTAAVVITLYASTGDETDNEFLRVAGTNPVTFVLDTTAPDTCPLPLINTVLANTGETQSFRELPLHVMEAH
jgi:hypothetical protein